MDDCFGDTVIDEDQIVFDFGDGDFELKQSDLQDPSRFTSDFDPTVDFEGVPELRPWSDPVRDQTLKIESHDFGLSSHDSKETCLETDSSQVSSSDERSQNLFAQVSAQDDVILSNSGATSSGNRPQNVLSSNSATSHFENSEASIFPLSRVSTTDGQHHSANVFQSSETLPHSSSPPAFPHISSAPVPPVSISPAFSPVASSPPFPPVSIPLYFPLVSSPQHPPCSSQLAGHDLTRPNETVNSSSSSFQFIEDRVSPPSEILSIQPSTSFNPPTTNPFHQPVNSSPPPHLPINYDDDDDDEFDFDELVASRTQFNQALRQSSSNVEEANEKKNEFPSDVKFDVDFGVKTEEIETKLTEDNRITVLLPGQRSEEAFDQASDEWDKVQTIEPEFEEGQIRTLKARVGTEPITYGEAVAVLDRNKLTQQFGASIRTSVVRGALASLFHRLCGGPRLHQRLHAERDFAFCLAACPFNNEDSIHCRVLFSIYKQLTGSKFDCSRFGSHWEIIGFQGQDPATDLRGVGFLALLQLLYLVTDLKTQALARSIYRLSLHETQNFPFSVMGINLTRITIAAMREDCLNKECNRRGQLLGVLNDFYIGLFHRLQVIWKTQRKTIRDTGFVLADLESYAKKHSQEMVRVQIQSTVDAPFQHQDGATRDIAHIDEHLF